MNGDDRNGAMKCVWGSDEEENQCANKDNYNSIGSSLHVSNSVLILNFHFDWGLILYLII